MDRKPPVALRRALRKEVGFGCPINGCGNPYLEYHHFDPPWHEREHHDMEGMIALCAEHHRKADAGAFNREQLRSFKRDCGAIVAGRFDWLRHRIFAVVGGNYYYETPIIVQFRDNPQIWYTRDEDGYLRLSLRMVSSSREPRLRLDENDWIVRGTPTDFESPPSGRRIFARYGNGDELRIEFLELASVDDAVRRYPSARLDIWSYVDFPITAIEIQNLIGGTQFGFGPTWSRIGGVQMVDCFSGHSPVGLAWS